MRKQLADAGYSEASEAGGPGTFSAWSDVDGRGGGSSADFLVVEDPARPIIDGLVERFGGSPKTTGA